MRAMFGAGLPTPSKSPTVGLLFRRSLMLFKTLATQSCRKWHPSGQQSTRKMNMFVQRSVCFVIACLAVSSLSVAADSPLKKEWTVDGVPREALVFAASQPTDGGSPVVFAFHGHGGTMRHAAATFAYQKHWPEAVVVYMQGLNTPGKLTDPEGKKSGWQSGPGDQKDRDLLFFDAVLASMKKDHPIDENRIYSTGHSNGGGFTYLLWAKRGDTFAAFAPVAASAGVYFITAKPKPKPLFHAASEKDPLVTFAMQQRTLTRVKKLNGCDEPGEDWAKGCLRYSSKQGTPVVIYLHGEGHKYPAATPALIVKFFKEHAKE